MSFIEEFLSLYLNHLSFIDWIILVLGGAVLVFQVRERKYLLAHQNSINKELLEAKQRASRVFRVTTVGIDGFPLLGLLGTVASLLVTFAGISGNKVTTNVISDFAPGLTSTVSGLACSLVNLVVLQMFLVPVLEGYHRREHPNG
ncbi:MAG: MotA/TolQ/ExbB proton channel family protein [Planctomycetaceae bacterium]